MCVTLFDARLGQTTIAGWRFPRRRTHCLLYGNEPENLAGVPNAMILHIPVAFQCTLTQDNFLPTEGLRHVLDDMWAAAPKYELREERGVFGERKTRGTVSVFDVGSYTWVVATQADPADIAAALETVRPDRRPQISRQLIEFYQRTWPYDALAIGCFSTAAGGATEPVCVEYPPQDWDILRYPATDAHGHVPAWGEYVQVDHRIIVGTSELGLGGAVRYREAARMAPRLAELLPGQVVGAELLRIPMIQGDFYVDFSRFGRDDATTGHVLRAHGPALDASADRIPALLG
jgi:hypothetical protein